MPIPRKRSCAQCRLAKTRCSLTNPQCTRCHSRSLDCDYSEAHPREISNIEPWAFSPSQAEGTSGVRVEQQDDIPLLPDLEMNEWDNQPSTINYPMGEIASWIEYPYIDISQTSTELLPRYQQISSNPEHSYLAALSLKLQLPLEDTLAPWPSQRDIPAQFHGLLGARRMESLAATLVGNHLLATFNTYPEMLLQKMEQLPPFIHRQSCSWEGSELPEPLANCIAFLPMFERMTKGSSAFVMRTLFAEMQRLYNEVSIFVFSSSWS